MHNKTQKEQKIYYLSHKDLKNCVEFNTNLNKNDILMFIDTGSDITVIKENVIEPDYLEKNLINETIQIKGITQELVSSLGTLSYEFDLENEIYYFKCHIVDLTFPINADGILGRDFFECFKATISYESNTLNFKNNFLKIFPTEKQIITVNESREDRKERLKSVLLPLTPNNSVTKPLIDLCLRYIFENVSI